MLKDIVRLCRANPPKHDSRFQFVEPPMLKCGLMDTGFSPHGPFGGGYPTSRDWSLPNFICNATKCVANIGGKCMAPASCEIGDDGRCGGFTKRTEGEKDENSRKD